MTKPISLLICVLSCCLFYSKAKAQTDSTYFDLGRVQLKKTFTQNITIKGSDLERYPFADLADAINVWAYGTYTKSSNLIYVIDSNIINDVNAYSIYDIDEITIIQNASAQASGASPDQQMVIIKTHIGGPGKQGIQVAEQSNLVSMGNQNNGTVGTKTTNLYDQFYLSGYKNYEDAHFGISADYQRDVLPLLSPYVSYVKATAFNYDRFKINGHADIRTWKGSVLNADISYTPQTSHYQTGVYVPSHAPGYGTNIYNHIKASQHDINLNLGLNSQITNGLINNVSVAHNHNNYFELDSNHYAYVPASTNSESRDLNWSYFRTSNLFIKDNLTYHGKIDDVSVEPSIDFSYQKLVDSISSLSLSSPGDTRNYGDIQSSTASGSGHIYLLTPSLNIYYKDFFNLQGGGVTILNPNKDFSPVYPKHRLSPFLTATFNISRITGLHNFDWRIFGSFSRQNIFTDSKYAQLLGFYSRNSANSQVPAFSGTTSLYFLGVPINPYTQYNSYQLGTMIKIVGNLTFSYAFEYRYYQAPSLIAYPTYPTYQTEIVYFNDKTTSNRFTINYSYRSANFSWRTGLNIAGEKLQFIKDQNLLNAYLGDNNRFLNRGHRWSGGFTNRLDYKGCFAGADVLYQLGSRPISILDAQVNQQGGYVIPANINSFSLQNLYAGTRLKINKLNYAEIYINSRNILQNKNSDITDNRRFIGLGFKAGL